jgi:hypothetical protein
MNDGWNGSTGKKKRKKHLTPRSQRRLRIQKSRQKAHLQSHLEMNISRKKNPKIQKQSAALETQTK